MRHPDDPDTVLDTKAVVVFCLGLLGAATGLALGGVIPASVALVLARQGAREIKEAEGWRTGVGYLVWGRRLAWIGLGLAAGSLVILVAIHLFQGIGGTHQDFPPTVD
jgi:hypothetical protein